MFGTSKTKSWSSAALIATAGACIATGGIASAADHPHADNDDQKVIVRKLHESGDWKAKVHRMGSWSDGEVEVSTTIEDGHIKVVVNGDVVYEGDLSGVTDLDLGEIKLHKLDGALTLFKDGHKIMQLGDGARIVIGDDDFDLSDLESLKLEALKNLGELKELQWVGDGENIFHFDKDKLKRWVGQLESDGHGFSFDGDQLKEWIARAQQGGGGNFVFAPDGDGDHPDVMLGINIDTGDDVKAKLHELNLDGDEVTVVMKAIEGLPAAKAGIKGGDIIIELNGTDGAGQAVLMELLGEKEPGEEIEVVLLRDGKPHKLRVELEAFDSGKLGVAPSVAPRVLPRMNSFFSGDHQQHMAEVSKRLAELALKLEGASGKKRDEITAELETMGKKMAEMARDTARFRFDFDFDDMGNMLHFSDEDEDGEPRMLHFGDGKGNFKLKMLPRIEIEKLKDGQRGFVIVSPDEDSDEVEVEVHTDSGSNADRVKELEAKIRRLEKILERLADDNSDGDV